MFRGGGFGLVETGRHFTCLHLESQMGRYPALMLHNTVLCGLRKVVIYKPMTYRETRKASKIHSDRQVAAKARMREENGSREPYIEIDPYIRITVERRATGEFVVFECFEGTRIDNYSVYCNEKHLGIQGITTLMANIRKALPRFRRMDI